MHDSRRLVTRGVYRFRQFWQAIWAGPLTEQSRQEIAAVLDEEQLALFLTQSEDGQQHSYRVMQKLVEAGHDQDELLVAALLHDVGKYRRRYTWLDRVKVVLTQRLGPKWAVKWANGPSNWWTRAYIVKANHPAWGAEALAQAGGSELSVALVRRHQELDPGPVGKNEEDRLLALLQWADDQS